MNRFDVLKFAQQIAPTIIAILSLVVAVLALIK